MVKFRGGAWISWAEAGRKGTDLTSTNANNYKVRPIISACEGPADKISWLLTKILTPLLHHVEAHLINTQHFINRLNQVQLPEEFVYGSFDVSSLYTNVNDDSAIYALSRALDNHPDVLAGMKFSTTDIIDLVKVCLASNIFRFNNTYYRQRRGLAMGNRLAPLLAVLFMDYIESQSLFCNPILYCRYIDDCFVVAHSADQFQMLLDSLNNRDLYITLTSELPNNGWLPFLNVEVGVCNGKFVTRWYRKPSCMNILLNKNSHHPPGIKNNMVTQTLKTSNELSSSTYKTYSEELARKVLRINGYSLPYHHRNLPRCTGKSDTSIPLIVPYVNNSFCTEIIEAVNKSKLPIHVICKPPANLEKYSCDRDSMIVTAIIRENVPFAPMVR